MNSEERKHIHRVLLLVQADPNPKSGICSYFVEGDSGTRMELRRLMAKWPKRSDCASYTVPTSEKNRCYIHAEGAYSTACFEGSMWSRETEYGRLRWELLEFLIKETAP